TSGRHGLAHSCDHPDGSSRRRNAPAIARSRRRGIPREALSERRPSGRRTSGSLVGVMALSTFVAKGGTLIGYGKRLSALNEGRRMQRHVARFAVVRF